MNRPAILRPRRIEPHLNVLFGLALPLETQALVQVPRSNVGLIYVEVQRLAGRSAFLDQRSDQMSADPVALEVGMDLNSTKENPILKSDDAESADIGAIEFDNRENAFRLVGAEPTGHVGDGARAALIDVDRRIGLRPDVGYHISEYGDVIPRSGAESDHGTDSVASLRLAATHIRQDCNEYRPGGAR
jgi:hypothetical protein